MSVTYRPTHKFLGQNNVSLEYELRKLSQKIESIGAVASGAMAIATSAEVAVGAAASSAAVAANTAAITLLQNDLDAVRLGLWS